MRTRIRLVTSRRRRSSPSPSRPPATSRPSARSPRRSSIATCARAASGARCPPRRVPDLAEEGDRFVAVVPFPEERCGAARRRALPLADPPPPLPHAGEDRDGRRCAMGDLAGHRDVDARRRPRRDPRRPRDDGAPSARPRSRPSCWPASVRTSPPSAAFLDARKGDVDELWSADPLTFIAGEQAGLVGHMAHPTAKSRWGIEPASSPTTRRSCRPASRCAGSPSIPRSWSRTARPARRRRS